MNEKVIGYVWYSQKQHYKSIRYRSFDAGTDHREPLHIIEAMNQDKMQQLMPQDKFPADIYAVEDANAHKKDPRHVFTFGFTVISFECAEILRQFDLGDGALVPVRLWRQDRKTRISGEFFYLTHGNRKKGFLPDRSPKAMAWAAGEEWAYWTPSPNPVDDQLYFSPAALGGVDVWCDDFTRMGLMLSDRLVEALRAAGVAKDWLLLRCPVIEI